MQTIPAEFKKNSTLEEIRYRNGDKNGHVIHKMTGNPEALSEYLGSGANTTGEMTGAYNRVQIWEYNTNRKRDAGYIDVEKAEMALRLTNVSCPSVGEAQADKQAAFNRKQAARGGGRGKGKGRGRGGGKGKGKGKKDGQAQQESAKRLPYAETSSLIFTQIARDATLAANKAGRRSPLQH